MSSFLEPRDALATGARSRCVLRCFTGGNWSAGREVPPPSGAVSWQEPRALPCYDTRPHGDSPQDPGDGLWRRRLRRDDVSPRPHSRSAAPVPASGSRIRLRLSDSSCDCVSGPDAWPSQGKKPCRTRPFRDSKDGRSRARVERVATQAIPAAASPPQSTHGLSLLPVVLRPLNCRSTSRVVGSIS